MFVRPIRSYSRGRSSVGRFCDVLIDGREVYLVRRNTRSTCEVIAWEDLKNQIEKAIRQSRRCH